MTTVGFIGLGHMGHPMVENLLQAKVKVIVYDVMLAATQSIANEGAMVADNIADLTKQSDVVISMVQTSQQVMDICLADDGVFAHLKKEAIYIDCSSIDMIATRMLHNEAEKRHLAMIDSPVSGGVRGAKEASLTFMVGGEEDHVKRALPILNKMGKKIIHAGPSGSGQAAKICNNLILGISMIGTSEAFILAKKLGLDQKKFYEISSNASGQCWAMTSNCPAPHVIENVPANHDYEPGFMAKMMLKDLRLAHHAAETIDASIPLGAVAAELYELYVNQGFGEKDFSGIINLLEGE